MNDGPRPRDTITLRARWVVPIATPPIENGFVEVVDGRIARIGTVAPGASIDHDLGDAAILPGLVNAHTHLEFSDFAAPIGRPNMELADWVIKVVQSRASRSGGVDDVINPSRNSIERGAIEAEQSGTALIGEIATTPWQSPRADVSILSYAEVLGLSPARGAERFHAAAAHVERHPHGAGISPHAPYSTPPELISRCVDFASQTGCAVAMHVAESPAERELLENGSGPFARSLQSLGLDLEGHFPWKDPSPTQSLIDLLALAPAASIVHGNDLSDEEIQRIARHPSLSVIYCPRTHAYFGHAPHPVADLLAAGIRVGLGTDSKASNPDLQLWREVQFLLKHRQDLAPESVLQMGTRNGAAAMQQDLLYGTLLPGRMATFAVVPTGASDTASLYADFALSEATGIRV